MKDIPIFTTQHGVASLILNQIPYTKCAYIRIQSTHQPVAFLEECVGFCRCAGGENVYATGHDICEKYPLYTEILQMRSDVSMIGQTDAFIFPVTEVTLESWRNLYNDKVIGVPNGAWMTIAESQARLKEGNGYFIHDQGKLLGIGIASGDQISWVASYAPGAGKEVVRALCKAISSETVVLEVASTNTKAMKLYKELGFVTTSILSKWYCVR